MKNSLLCFIGLLLLSSSTSFGCYMRVVSAENIKLKSRYETEAINYFESKISEINHDYGLGLRSEQLRFAWWVEKKTREEQLYKGLYYYSFASKGSLNANEKKILSLIKHVYWLISDINSEHVAYSVSLLNTRYKEFKRNSQTVEDNIALSL